MKQYITQRLLQLIPTLFGVSVLCFVLMQLSVSDFVDIRYENTGTALSNEALEDIRAEFGLDLPVSQQYANWLLGLFRGDFGTSFYTGEDVLSLLLSKMPNTLLLSLASLIITCAIALPLGVIGAFKQGGAVDNIIKVLSFAASSLPSFVIAFLLIFILAVQLKLFPVISTNNTAVGVILPSLSLGLAMSSKYIRQVRSVVVEELSCDYVAGLRSRGIKERNIMLKSVLRASMIPLLTLFSLSFGSLLGGTAIIESIFMWDGIGKTAVDAILVKDYPVVQAYVLFMTSIYIVINLCADILYHLVDPRLRAGGDYAM